MPPIDRRDLLRAGCALGSGLVLESCTRWRVVPRFDLVIHGGTIVDGGGNAPFRADLGLQGETIAAIGAIGPANGTHALDARGLHVAPGFVDMHSHSDRTLRTVPTADSRVLQGYTCELTGNCGGSAAPRRPGLAGTVSWTGVKSYLYDVETARPSIHHALLVGHGTLRSNQIGDADRETTARELAEMVRELEQALEDGAFGLSSGLEYVPGIYTPPDELEYLARVIARRGRLYASHMRNEDVRLFEAVDEAITVARDAGARVQISHLKCAGRGNWWKQEGALERIEKARAEGLDVLADAYPYTAYSTSLTVLFPSWAREGGNEELLKRLADQEQRARIRAAVAERVSEDPGAFELIQIASKLSAKNAAFVGKTIADVAAARGGAEVDALLDLVADEHAETSYIGHAMSLENVSKVLAHPLVMIGSDGYVMPREAPEGEASNPHPRSFGTAARVLGEFCRERRVLDVQTAVKKLATMPAERIGLTNRGRIARGFKADLVLFDLARVKDETTFTDPRRPPSGIERVFVDGVLVVDRGRHTGARPGKVLRA